MSFLRRDPAHQPTQPQPNTVLAEPATPEACADDYANRTGGTPMHPSSLDAQPHTYGRRS